jgi:hypothetical protein
MSITINVDFDGTVVTHAFPHIGKDIGAVLVLKALTDAGHKLILFTMRSDRYKKGETGDTNILDVTGSFLTQAVKWFEDNGIPLYGIQSNPSQGAWTTSPKSYAELMIDDSALGCPLKYNKKISNRPFVDWKEVEKLLKKKNLI